jgi:phosphodiesterase/alkaline phosphatase D-like protein
MKSFVLFRIAVLAFVAGFMVKATPADASVTFLGVAAGDATTDDATVWTRAKDESNPQATAINVQISTDPTFISGVTTLLAGTADAPTDYTVKTNVAGLQSAAVYYYRFQTLDASVTDARCYPSAVRISSRSLRRFRLVGAIV